MSDLQQRKYYKLFTGTNQEEGYDKIHLGYEGDTTEITLKKDEETFFHMPFFSEPQLLSESTLVADGAVPGPIPALADRIFKKLGNYGNTTPWGTPSERSDGQWLCSWLYALSSEPPVWLDRYYNPGRLAYKEALEGKANITDYIGNDPVYRDIPTTLKLEPGVLYRYFHQGERTALKNINTFAGPDKTRLRLDIEDWSCLCPTNPEPIDRSVYNNTVTIDNFKLDWIKSPFDPGYLDRNSLSFNNTDFINCYVTHNDSYTLQDEFTTSFWVYNDDWSKATPTQLVGNLRNGGYGIFYNNLHYNPFYVVPENTYGHFFYFNQEGNPYVDKNNQLILGEPSNFSVININSNAELIGVDANKNRIVKYNHVGDIIAYGSDTDGYISLNGTFKNFIVSGTDDSIVFTSLSAYTFDKDLQLKTVVPHTTGYYEQITYDTFGNLIVELSCIDIKYDSYNQKWTIDDTGILKCDNLTVNIPSNQSGSNTNLAIDPENNLWVLVDSHIVYKINTKNKNIIDQYEVGVQTNTPDTKNISFIQVYDRSKNAFTWYAVIYHNFEKTLYQVTLNGKVVKNTFLPPKLNTLDPVTAFQDKNLLTFTGKGDFTGYEQRRIFNKVLYNNNPQIQFKVSATYPNRSLPTSIFTLSVPAQYLVNGIWHLITVTVRSNNLKIYINNYLRDELTLPGNANFNYEFKNDLFIGTPAGKIENLNKELNSTSIIWNGYIDSVRIYDYAIKPELIQFFVREKTIANDMIWNIKTAALQYVEVIDRFFKHRLPGSKSVFFNLKITGTNIVDLELRKRIENDIKLAVLQIKPAYAELLKVEWVD